MLFILLFIYVCLLVSGFCEVIKIFCIILNEGKYLVLQLYNSSFPLHYFPNRVKSWLSGSIQFSSVAQSCLTLCYPMDYSTPRPPCLPPTPRVYSNSCPLTWWCHPTILTFVVNFSSCLQSFEFWFYAGFFMLLSPLFQEALWFLFAFCCKGAVICI